MPFTWNWHERLNSVAARVRCLISCNHLTRLGRNDAEVSQWRCELLISTPDPLADQSRLPVEREISAGPIDRPTKTRARPSA